MENLPEERAGALESSTAEEARALGQVQEASRQLDCALGCIDRATAALVEVRGTGGPVAVLFKTASMLIAVEGMLLRRLLRRQLTCLATRKVR